MSVCKEVGFPPAITEELAKYESSLAELAKKLSAELRVSVEKGPKVFKIRSEKNRIESATKKVKSKLDELVRVYVDSNLNRLNFLKSSPFLSELNSDHTLLDAREQSLTRFVLLLSALWNYWCLKEKTVW
jgi:hypothetical protein